MRNEDAVYIIYIDWNLLRINSSFLKKFYVPRAKSEDDKYIWLEEENFWLQYQRITINTPRLNHHSFTDTICNPWHYRIMEQTPDLISPNWTEQK